MWNLRKILLLPFFVSLQMIIQLIRSNLWRLQYLAVRLPVGWEESIRIASEVSGNNFAIYWDLFVDENDRKRTANKKTITNYSSDTAKEIYQKLDSQIVQHEESQRKSESISCCRLRPHEYFPGASHYFNDDDVGRRWCRCCLERNIFWLIQNYRNFMNLSRISIKYFEIYLPKQNDANLVFFFIWTTV